MRVDVTVTRRFLTRDNRQFTTYISCKKYLFVSLFIHSFYHDATAPSGPGLTHHQVFMITLKTRNTRSLWTSDRPIAETST